MPLGSESSSVQRPFVRYAVEAMVGLRRAALAALFQSLLDHLMTARLLLPEFLNAKRQRRPLHEPFRSRLCAFASLC
jgi:hypothetical protein